MTAGAKRWAVASVEHRTTRRAAQALSGLTAGRRFEGVGCTCAERSDVSSPRDQAVSFAMNFIQAGGAGLKN